MKVFYRTYKMGSICEVCGVTQNLDLVIRPKYGYLTRSRIELCPAHHAQLRHLLMRALLGAEI